MKIVLIGSYRKHHNAIFQVREHFIADGAQVLRPETEEILSIDGFVRLAGDADNPEAIQEIQLKAIEEADAVYVVNPGGYIGPSGMLEIGYAYAKGIPVYAAEEPYEPGAKHVISLAAKPARVVELLRTR